MDHQPKVEKAFREEVGRLFSSTKVRFEWVVRIRDRPVTITFIDSKRTKTRRLSINGKKCVEEINNDPNFQVIIDCDGHTVAVFPDGSDFRLKIDNVVDRTPFVKSKNPDLQDSAIVKDLEITRDKSWPIRLKLTESDLQLDGRRSDATNNRANGQGNASERSMGTKTTSNGNLTSENRIGIDSSQTLYPQVTPVSTIPQSTPGLSQPNQSQSPISDAPPFDPLNDSGEFYTHAQHFMMIKEPQENLDLVRKLNLVGK